MEPLARGASGLETGRRLVERSGGARRAARRNQIGCHPQKPERAPDGVGGRTIDGAAAIAIGDANPGALFGVGIHVALSTECRGLTVGWKRITGGVQEIPGDRGEQSEGEGAKRGGVAAMRHGVTVP